MERQPASNDVQFPEYGPIHFTPGKENGHYGYLVIALFVLSMYVATIEFYVRFTETVLPINDPFTYTFGFFVLLDYAQHDYWGTLKMVLTSRNWYWLMNIPIVLLSPLLVKEPFSLSVVNFLMYGLATASFFRLARHLGFSAGFSFILALILWIYPVNYGFMTYSSVPVLTLDAMFSGVLYVAIAHMLIYAMDPSKIKNAVIAGVTAGIAVWGRGNSLPVVGLVIFCPLVVAASAVWKQKSRSLLVNFIIFGLIAAGLSAYFYIINWTPITTYYTVHAAFVERHSWNLHDAMPYIKNIPGFFFWRAEDSIATISISWISHALMLLGLYIGFKRSVQFSERHRNALKLLTGTGAFIYFCTYFANILLFTDPLMTIYNVLYIWRPMLIGLTLCIIVVLSSFVITREIRIGQWVMLPLAVVALSYGFFFTDLQTPLARTSDRPTPREVESLALRLDELLKGGTLSVLWYQNYNPVILLYYRAKNDLPDVKLYTNKYYYDIWSQYDYTDENRKRIREGIRKHFEEATLNIIPEYSDLYYQHQPYALYKFRDEIVDYLNSPESPRFVVRMILHDTPTARLLVLQREDEAGGKGEPLKLPYGPSGGPPRPDYSDKVIRHR